MKQLIFDFGMVDMDEEIEQEFANNPFVRYLLYFEKSEKRMAG